MKRKTKHNLRIAFSLCLIVTMLLGSVVTVDMFYAASPVQAAELSASGSASVSLVPRRATFAQTDGRGDYTKKSQTFTKDYTLSGTQQTGTVAISATTTTTSSTQALSKDAGTKTLDIPASSKADVALRDLSGYDASRVYEIEATANPSLSAARTTVAGYASSMGSSAGWSLSGGGTASAQAKYNATGTSSQIYPSAAEGSTFTAGGYTYYVVSKTSSRMRVVVQSNLGQANWSDALANAAKTTNPQYTALVNAGYKVNTPSTTANSPDCSLITAKDYDYFNPGSQALGHASTALQSAVGSHDMNVTAWIGSKDSNCTDPSYTTAFVISIYNFYPSSAYTSASSYVVPAYTIVPNPVYTYSSSYTSPTITYTGSKAVSHSTSLGYFDSTPGYLLKPQSTAVINDVSSSLGTYNDGTSSTVVAINDTVNSLSVGFDGKEITNAVNGSTYQIPYTDAVVPDSGEKYVSAAIYEAEDLTEPVYYGRLGKVTAEEGSVDLTIPDGLTDGGDYVLAVFEETASDETGKTYSMSTPAVATFTASKTYYTTEIAATAVPEVVEYGSLLTNKDIAAVETLSNGQPSIITSIYVLPTDVWNSIPESAKNSIDKVKSISGVNAVVIPSEDDMEGAYTYSLTVVYFDTTERHGTNDVGTNCGSATRFETEVTVALPEIHKDYLSYTKNGVTWYYKVNDRGDSDPNNDTAINVHTTNEDIGQYVDLDGSLNVPSMIDRYPVESIGSGLKERPFIPAGINTYTSITFPNRTISINDYGFYSNTASVRLVVPNTISNIGDFAFYNCDNFMSITIQCADTKIGVAAFGNCEKLKSVIINGKASIGGAAFAENPELKKVTLNGAIDIGKSAFAKNTSLNALNLDTCTGTINAYAFDGCTGISSLYIPNGAVVKAQAFANCTGLTELELDITKVENQSFSNCSSLEYVIFGTKVETVEYNWGGYSTTDVQNGESKVTDIVVRKGTTLFETYTDGSEYYSAFMGHKNAGGASAPNRTVRVKFDQTAGSSLGQNENVYSYTCSAYNDTNNSLEDKYTADGAIAVTFTADTEAAGSESLKAPKHRDGIDAFYNGKVYSIMEDDRDNREEDTTGRYKIQTDKFTVTPTYTDADPTGDSLSGFYFYNAADANSAILQWMQESDYTYRNVITDEDTPNHYSYYVTRYTDNPEALATQTAAMVANIYETKEYFLSACEGILNENAAVKKIPENYSSTMQTLTVIYYPGEGDADYRADEPAYYTTTIDIKVVQYTPEQGFFDAGLTYATVVETIDGLNRQIEELTGAVSSYEEALSRAEGENASLTAELATAKAELETVTARYNSLVNDFAELLGQTPVTESDYTYTNTETGTDYVIAGDRDYAYDKTAGFPATVSGNPVTVYQGTEDEDFYFYIDRDGVHEVTLSGEEGSYTVETDVLSTTRVGMMQKKLLAEITAMRTDLDTASERIRALEEGYSTIADALGLFNETFTAESFLALPDEEKVSKITEAVTTLKDRYNTLQEEYETLLNDSTGDATETARELSAYRLALSNIRTALSLTGSGSDISDIEAAISALEQKYTTLQSGLDALLSGLGIETEAGATDNEKLNAIRETVTGLIEDYTALETRYDRILRKIYNADETVNLSEKTLDEVLLQIDALAGDTEAIAASLEEAISGNAVSPENAEELGALILKVEQMRESLTAKSALLQQILDVLGITDSAAIIRTITDLKTKFSNLTAKNSALETENAGLKQQVSSTTPGTPSNVVDKESASYKSGYDAGYSEGSSKANSNNSATVTNLAMQNASLSQQNASLSQQNASLSQQNETLTKQNTALQKENKELEISVDSLAVEIDALYEELLMEDLTLYSIEEELTLYSIDTVSETRSKLKKIRQTIAGMKNEYSKLAVKNESLAGKYETITDTNEDLKAANRELKTANAKLQTSVETLTSQKDSFAAQVKELQAEKKSLTATVEDLRSKNKTLEAQVSSGETTVPAPTEIPVVTIEPEPTKGPEEEPESVILPEPETDNPETTFQPEPTEAVTETPIEGNPFNGEGNQFHTVNPDTMEEDTESEEEPSGSIVPLVIIGGAFVALVGAIIYFLVIRPGRKTAADDIDDDEETA